MPFGLHLPELIIVLVVALLIVGPKKLPEMGSAIGKSITAFKKGVNEISTPTEPKASLKAPTAAPKDAVEENSNPYAATSTSEAETETVSETPRD